MIKEMKKIKSESKLSILLSFTYSIFFIYYIIFQYFAFSPILSIVRESSNYDEIYSKNDIGFLYWKGRHINKIIFYLNDWNGNCSTRIGKINHLKRQFPDFSIVQIEYPGYGISSHLNLSIETMIDACGDMIMEFINERKIEKYCFWTEGMGGYILWRVMNRFEFEPKCIFYFNSFPSMEDFFYHYYSYFGYLFIFSSIYYDYKKIKYPKNKPSIYYFYNDELNMDKYSQTMYFSNKDIPIEKKKIIKMEGKGNSTYFLSKNLNIMEKILKKNFI